MTEVDYAMKRRITFREMLLVGVCLVLTFIGNSVAETAEELDVCQKPVNLASCRASIPAWFYNSSSADCEEFVYGGCPSQDEDNRFRTKEGCIRKCGQDICAMNAETGPCRASFPRWYYNWEARMCEEFIYGGCEGNSNSFGTKESCERACSGAFLPCELGRSFEGIGKQAVTTGFRQDEWYTHSCERRCRLQCLDDQPWGYCLAYSVRERWYGCNCYLFDRYLSDLEFDPDTKGITKNRNCEEEAEPGHL